MTIRRLHLWLPPLIYAGLIFHLSSQSDPLPAVTTHVWDKLLHTVEYAGFAFLVGRACLGEGITVVRAALLTLVLSSLYGATDEWHQSFVPLRSADVLDWLADTVGSTLGAGVWLAFGVWSKTPPDSR
jgi:VanZ family protein